VSEDTNTEIGSSDGVLPSVEKQQAREAASDAKLDRVVREAALEIYTRPDHDELAVSNAEAAVDAAECSLEGARKRQRMVALGM
jgi:hypothetical protein